MAADRHNLAAIEAGEHVTPGRGDTCEDRGRDAGA
jgi:hypothetical protein